MKTEAAYFTALCLPRVPLVAQAPRIITVDEQSRHHLALHNRYVKLFTVKVALGDSILPHRHDQNTIAIAIGEQRSCPSASPARPSSGCAQTNFHNACAEILPGQPLHCLGVSSSRSESRGAVYLSKPELDSDGTQLRLVSVPPGGSIRHCLADCRL